MAQSQSTSTLLVVDDDPINRMVLGGILTMNGYTFLEAGSGQEALNLVDKHQGPMLVLLDMLMPRMSGFDVCRRLRETYNSVQLPIIFLTAKSRDESFDEAIAAGGNALLTKPIEKTQLLHLLSQFVPASSAH